MNNSRRDFLKKGSMLGVGTLAGFSAFTNNRVARSGVSSTLAIAGGNPVRTKKWPGWPQWDPATMDEEVMRVIRSGVWSRANVTDEFEKQWAAALGAKRSLVVVNGTNALYTSLVQYGIGGGDEVLVPAYTFIASVQAILMTGAIPVFVDVDPETFQIDTKKVGEKITKNTKAIMPVHILGLPADMPEIMRLAVRYNLIVIEDACQAHLAEINHRKVGTIGDAGCFSFQNSKNLAIGEGGAIVSDNDKFLDRCFSFQNYGNPYGAVVGAVGAGTIMQGTKLRITEYQSAIGLVQLKKLKEQTDLRGVNAEYLKSRIKEIPGIIPYRLYDHVTKAAFHLFPFKFIGSEFKGMTKPQFINALKAEGIPCSAGYAPLNKMPFIQHAFQTKNFKLMYPESALNYADYLANNQCPVNDRLCNEEMIWLTQSMLLSAKTDMDDIYNAIEKIYNSAVKTK